MPLQFDDVAHHATTLPNLGERIKAILEAVRSRVSQLSGREDQQRLLADLDAHNAALVGAVAGNDATGNFRGRLGPNETPFMPGDRPMSAAESERHSNPLSPVDSSGAKVHPADALTNQGRTDPAAGQGFGGNGVGTSADVRTQAALAARDGDLAPGRSLQEQEADRAREASTLTGGTVDDGKPTIIPDEIVAGSEVERAGIKYVTKKRADGTTYEAVDDRPPNEPMV